MPKIDVFFKGGLTKIDVDDKGGRGSQKFRKFDDVFYECRLTGTEFGNCTMNNVFIEYWLNFSYT